MVMRFQTWDNGKYGRIWAVNDDDYSRKFTEIINGCASEEDFQNSPVIASHFIGYCINNEPKGDGDFYTPFFTTYYNERLEKFRKKHKDDIRLIRDAKRLEALFLNEHFEEESQAFKKSEVLFDYDSCKAKPFLGYYYAYLDFLREKMPRYFVFKETPFPQVFQWREFDKIAVMGYAVTELCLNQVLDWSLGRVFASDIILRGVTPTAEDKVQIKVVYGDTVKPSEISYIRFNTTDKKKMAQSIYDKLRLDMKQRQFNNSTELQLILEHAERWFNGIVETGEQRLDIEVVKRQLVLCLREIDDDNKEEHKPFSNYNNEPFNDDAVAGMDRYGYSAQPYQRLNNADFKNMMEAFDRWAMAYYGQDSDNTSNDEEVTKFKPLSNGFHAYLYGLYSTMCEETIIENIDYLDFVECITHADFSSFYSIARANRNQNRLFLIVKRIKTWFPEDWAQKVASSMGTTVGRIDKVSPTEIEKSNKAWYKCLDKTCPIYHPKQ